MVQQHFEKGPYRTPHVPHDEPLERAVHWPLLIARAWLLFVAASCLVGLGMYEPQALLALAALLGGIVVVGVTMAAFIYALHGRWPG